MSENPQSKVSRWLFDGWVINDEIQPSAFTLRKIDRVKNKDLFCLSVSTVTNMKENTIWQYCADVFPKHKDVVARADLFESQISLLGLSVAPSPTTTSPKHSCIHVDINENQLQAAEALFIATELAEAATLKLKP